MKNNMKNYYLFISLLKVNTGAKTCNVLKKSAYEQKDHEKVQYYKKQQKYLYLLKSLTILTLKESGVLRLENNKYIQEDSSAILLSYVTTDGSNFNFHSLCSDQEVNENEEYLEFKNRNQENRDSTTLLGLEVYKRFLIKNLSEKYKTILDIFNEDMEIKLRDDTLSKLKDNKITCGNILYRTQWEYTEQIYDFYLEGILLCNAFGYRYDYEDDTPFEDYYTCIEDGYLEYGEKW